MARATREPQQETSASNRTPALAMYMARASYYRFAERRRALIEVQTCHPTVSTVSDKKSTAGTLDTKIR